MKKVRWGIMGAANIARKNWQAIRNSGNGTVVAVASRDLARAKQFINECQVDAPMEGPGQAYGNYDALFGTRTSTRSTFLCPPAFAKAGLSAQPKRASTFSAKNRAPGTSVN